MQPLISIDEEDEQARLMIQREAGLALRLSFDAVTCEPLPASMALLLLRLALAQSLRIGFEQEWEADGKKGHRPLRQMAPEWLMRAGA
jgi:hypothetical protein